MKRLLFVAALAAFALGAAPKKAGVPSIGETIEVNIVSVDVVVTDKNGNRVRGLTKDDFIILEGSVQREISNFAEYKSTNAAEGEPSAQYGPPQKRTVAIFIERANLLPHDANDLIESIRGAVHSAIRPGDHASLILWSSRAQTRIEFDGGLAGFDDALDTVKKRLVAAPEKTDWYAEEAADIRAFNAEVKRSVPEQDINESVENVAFLAAMRQRSEIQRKTRAINAVINSMATAEGKKILLLATHRLGEFAGLEYYIRSDIPILEQEARLRFQTREQVDSIVENANAADVSVYPVFATGVQNQSPETSSLHHYHVNLNEMQSLTRIARATGGVEASGTTEFANVARLMESDLTDYYSLAYRLDSTRADRSVALTVKTKNPDYRVRSRRGYVVKSNDTRMKDRLMTALQSSAVESMFRIDAAVGRPSGRVRATDLVPLRVRIPVQSLTVVPRGNVNAGAFSVYILAGGADDRISDVVQQTQPFEIAAAELERARQSHFTYDVEVRMRNDTNRVAVGVLDEVSGSYAVVRVPVERESP